VVLAAGTAAADISRTEVLDRAKAYVFYPFRTNTANQTASCAGDYQSAYQPGDHMGVSYDWGGWASLFDFDQKLGEGYGAGSPAFGDVYWCTVGVDCSGFVSRAWQTNQKYATISIPDISSSVSVGNLLVGDVFNKTSYHVAMYIYTLANGEPYMYEAVGYNTHVNATGGWSYVSEFATRRYDSITGTSAVTPVGTLNEPIEVSSFPYTDSRSTSTSLSDLLDGCGEQPGTSESGPEVIYQVEVTEPGTLTVAVSDDASADIDVHLYESWNTDTCVARNDSNFSHQVDCGTYYVVADTYGSDANAGNYDLTINFTAAGGQSCGAGPAGYDPSGGLGDTCSYPDNENLGFCNPTLGGDICLYTTGAGSTSFCTTSCGDSSDCGGLGAGSCCADIGDNQFYCLTSEFCNGEEPPGEEPPGGDGGDGGDGNGGDGNGGTAGPGPRGDGGGGCAAAGGNGSRSGLLLIAMMALAFGWRRRRR
jgi:MYXO-CTERM domain-containing protein